MKLNQINNILEKFSKEHDLINRAVELCKVAIVNSFNENPEEGYSLEETELRFDKQVFVFNHHFFTTPNIETKIGLFKIIKDVTREDDYIKYGSYILNTDSEGNHFDDWLIFEE